MKNLIIPCAALITALLAPSSVWAAEVSVQSTATEPTHVIELFTSQGCSSCPPVNNFVSKLAADPSNLVLSYGVTYWDYLGWEDTFGRPEFTQRQRDYRDALDAANIYTPQIVLGGSAHSPRYSKRDVADMALPEGGVNLSVIRSGDMLKVTANTAKDVIIDVISFTPGEQAVDVKRGENGGRTIKLMNVVKAVKTIDWNGQSATINMPKANATEYAVLVHDRQSAKILDAEVVD